MKKSHTSTISALIILIIAGLTYWYLNEHSNSAQPVIVEHMPSDFPLESDLKESDLRKETITVKSGHTLEQVLRSVGLNGRELNEIHTQTKSVKDLARIRPGQVFEIFHDKLGPTPGLVAFKVIDSVLERHLVYRSPASPEKWNIKHIQEPVEYKNITYTGVVESSLWASAEEASMAPELIGDLSEIFAWQIDFAREVQPQDKWRLVVEQPMLRGEPVGRGKILVAEYSNNQNVHTGVLFRLNGEDLGYFAPDGSSLKRMFLKAPVAFSRISSRFTRARFHPVLKVYRPHMGVDYAAPTGTPIRSVGDGRVSFAAWSGGGGKVIKIKHNSTYETAYKHLSRFAPGIKAGARVKQGQLIGYVGSTGLSSGPHLHFEFYENGRYVDPLGKKFPKAEPVPQNQLQKFQADGAELIKQLPSWATQSRV